MARPGKPVINGLISALYVGLFHPSCPFFIRPSRRVITPLITGDRVHLVWFCRSWFEQTCLFYPFFPYMQFKKNQHLVFKPAILKKKKHHSLIRKRLAFLVKRLVSKKKKTAHTGKTTKCTAQPEFSWRFSFTKAGIPTCSPACTFRFAATLVLTKQAKRWPRMKKPRIPQT